MLHLAGSLAAAASAGSGDASDVVAAWKLFAAISLALVGFLAFVAIVVILRFGERRRPKPSGGIDGSTRPTDAWAEAGRRTPTPPPSPST